MGSESRWQVIEKPTSRSSQLLSPEDKEICIKGKPIQVRNYSSPIMPACKKVKSKVSGDFYVPVVEVDKTFCESTAGWSNLNDISNAFIDSTNRYSQTPVREATSSTMRHYGFSGYITPSQNKKLTVPTNRQREEASRQLREFQIAQVSKIIQKKAIKSNLGPNL